MQKADAILKRIELQVDWSIDDFESLGLFAEVFNLADRIALSDKIINAGDDKIIFLLGLDERRILSHQNYQRALEFFGYSDLEFHPTVINFLNINSPPKFSVGTTLSVVSLAWCMLATDFNVMSRNIDSLRIALEEQTFSAQLKMLTQVNEELGKVEELILKYRSDIRQMRREIEEKKIKASIIKNRRR